MSDSPEKRRRTSYGEKLIANEAIEVRSFDDGHLGSWHPGIITERERNRCLVKYDHLASDDQEEYLFEYVDISSSINGTCHGLESSKNYLGKIRPKPSEVYNNKSLQYGICVDAYYKDAWREGVVFDSQGSFGEWRVFFPDEGDEEIISSDKLRLTQEWNEATGEWSLRGKWLFLDVVDELKPDHIFPVSIKQIWNGLRESQNYVRVMKHWTFLGKDVWKDLILEVLNKYLKMVADELVESKNCPEAITEYLQYWTCQAEKKKKTLLELSTCAREHLLSTGWKISSKRKPRFTFLRRTKDIFTSPWKINYYSLLQACKAVRDAAQQQSSIENQSGVLPSSANSESKQRMSPRAPDNNRETSSRGFSLSQEAVDDEFFNMLEEAQQLDPECEQEVPEKVQAPSVEVTRGGGEDDSKNDSNVREKHKHPQDVDELFLDLSWLSPPPALLSESMNSQNTSANQMAAVILYTTRMLAQKASSLELVEKVESQAARIVFLEAEVGSMKNANTTILSEQAKLSKFHDYYKESYEAASEQAAKLVDDIADLKRKLEEQQEKLRVEKEHWKAEVAKKKNEIREAEEVAVSKFVGSNRMTSWVNYYNRYRTTLILQMVRAQTTALGLKDFQLDMEARLGFPVHPPPYEHPPPGTFADDGDHPIDAWEIFELKTKTILAEGVSPSALPNPCVVFKTPPVKGSGTKRKAEAEANFATPKKFIPVQPKIES